MKITNKPIFLLFCFLFFSTTILAQMTKIDSLKNELQKHAKKDTVKVNLLNAIAFKHIQNDIHLAQKEALEALELADSINFTRGKARSFVVLSNIHISKSEYDAALTNGLKGLELFQEINNSYGISSTYNILGTIRFRQNNIEEAQMYFNKGLAIAKEKGKEKLQSMFLNSLGNISFSKGDLDEAQEFFRKSNIVNEKLGEIRGLISTNNNIAVIHMIQGRSYEALKSFNKNLEIHRKNNNKDGIATATLNISDVYSVRNQPEKALVYLKESLEINKELESKRGIAKCLVNIGAIYLDAKKYQESKEFLTEALTINTSINNLQGQITCHNHIGDLFLKQGQIEKALKHFKSSNTLSEQSQSKIFICYSNISLAKVYLEQKKYLKALQHGQKGEKLAISLDLLEQQKEINQTLSKIYEATGKYDKSLKHFKLHKVLNDSLFNKENIEKITQLEYEHKYKQQLDSASIRELQLKKTVTATNIDLKKSKQNYLWAIIGFLLVSILLGSVIFYQKYGNIKSKAQNIIIEQRLLRSQMTPHFIFNSLSVLQGMILNKEENKSIYYLSKFSKLLRIILENSRDQTVSLSNELSAIQHYLALQNLEDEAYDYTVLVEETIDVPLFEIPPMLIQPFVENAIEHAFGNQKENRKIDIRLTYLQKQLICTISDNGMGIGTKKETNNLHKKSLATTITSERLKILSKDLKIKGSITIEDREKYNEKGTLVTLIIPHKILEE